MKRYMPTKTGKNSLMIDIKYILNYKYKIMLTVTELFQFQFSRLVMSNSLQPHGLQHPRPPCLSTTPGVYSNSCPLSQWCHATILSSVDPLLLLPTIPPSIRVFQMSQLFASGGQSIGASASLLPMNIQGWFCLGLTSLISLQSKGLSRILSNTTVQKYQFFGAHLSLWSNSHSRTWLLGKP